MFENMANSTGEVMGFGKKEAGVQTDIDEGVDVLLYGNEDVDHFNFSPWECNGAGMGSISHPPRSHTENALLYTQLDSENSFDESAPTQARKGTLLGSLISNEVREESMTSSLTKAESKTISHRKSRRKGREKLGRKSSKGEKKIQILPELDVQSVDTIGENNSRPAPPASPEYEVIRTFPPMGSEPPSTPEVIPAVDPNKSLENDIPPQHAKSQTVGLLLSSPKIPSLSPVGTFWGDTGSLTTSGNQVTVSPERVPEPPPLMSETAWEWPELKSNTLDTTSSPHHHQQSFDQSTLAPPLPPPQAEPSNDWTIDQPVNGPTPPWPADADWLVTDKPPSPPPYTQSTSHKPKRRSTTTKNLPLLPPSIDGGDSGGGGVDGDLPPPSSVEEKPPWPTAMGMNDSLIF